MRTFCVILPLVLNSIIGPRWATGVHLYVSPHGSNTNNGTSVQVPLQSLRKAVDVANHWKPANETVYIELLAGYHDLDQTLYISRPNLVIRSYNNQEVHVTGGRMIPSTAFKQVTDHDVLSRLPAIARTHVRVVHLPDVPITDFGKLESYGSWSHSSNILEVFYNGNPLHLAQFPNKDYLNIVSLPDGSKGAKIKYQSSVPMSWHNETAPWVYGFWSNGNEDKSFEVKSLDAIHQTVTLPAPLQNGFVTGHIGRPDASRYNPTGGFFRFINILSALDEPGEYYLDSAHGNLYVWMPSSDGSVNSSDVVYVSMIRNCIQFINNVSSVTLQQFTLEACRGYGIVGAYNNDIHISNLEIRNTGGIGISIGGDCRGILIEECLIHDTDAGINLSGGDRVTLESSGNVILNNEIYDISRKAAVGSPAIYVRGVGFLIRHNHIYSGKFTAIFFSGNDNILEYNLIHDVCTEICVCDGLNINSDWTMRGNEIRYNIIHDILNRNTPGPLDRAVMLGGQISGVSITNNVFYNNDMHLYIDGGRDNIIENNIFYNATNYSIEVNGRGISRRYEQSLLKALQAVPYNSATWLLRYPELVNFDHQNYSLPEGNRICKNVVFNAAHVEYIHGFTAPINNERYYNISLTGFSVGEGDHFNVDLGDYRVHCMAGEWANHVNFQQVQSTNDVGPVKEPGPAYLHRGRRHMVPSVPPHACTTHAPATQEPMHAYLPDGTRENTIIQVPQEGCWLSVSKCTNDPHAVGTYRDMYGERYQHAADNATMCFRRAVAKWEFCGAVNGEAVAAIYGPTGAMTYGGDGCFTATYGCPKHGGPTDEHIVPGNIRRDFFAEGHLNATTDQEACLARALNIWFYCGSSKNHPVTQIFRPTGATRTAGAGCWISVEDCPKHQEYNTTFYDAWGAANHETDDVEIACLNQAEYYWTLCGSNPAYPVTATYRPTTVFKIFP